MSQGAVLQIGVHLLDLGVFAVGFVRSDRVQNLGVHGGEERVVPVSFEQGGLSVTGFLVQFRDAAHHQSVGDLLTLFAGGECGEHGFGDLGRRDPGVGGLIEDRIGIRSFSKSSQGSRR